jgi:hypothetical protein
MLKKISNLSFFLFFNHLLHQNDANLTKTDHTLIKEVAEDLDKIKLTL